MRKGYHALKLPIHDKYFLRQVALGSCFDAIMGFQNLSLQWRHKHKCHLNWIGSQAFDVPQQKLSRPFYVPIFPFLAYPVTKCQTCSVKFCNCPFPLRCVKDSLKSRELMLCHNWTGNHNCVTSQGNLKLCSEKRGEADLKIWHLKMGRNGRFDHNVKLKTFCPTSGSQTWLISISIHVVACGPIPHPSSLSNLLYWAL